MTLNDISDPTIASKPYSDRKELEVRISKQKWIEFVEANSGSLTWHENTTQGKNRLKNLEKYPDPFREKMKKILNRTQAMGNYSEETGKHDYIVEYIDEYGTISTTFEKKITLDNLKVLIKMAKYVDGILLNHGTDIVDSLDL